MFRSHHISLILADERRRDLTRLGESARLPRHPLPQPERRMEDRFLESVKYEPAPTPSSRRATIRVWRPGGERRFRFRSGAERPVEERELDRV